MVYSTLTRSINKKEYLMVTTPDLPGNADCRTKFLCADLFNCLSENARCCRYAMPFGNGYFCKHPNRGDFTETSSSG